MIYIRQKTMLARWIEDRKKRKFVYAHLHLGQSATSGIVKAKKYLVAAWLAAAFKRKTWYLRILTHQNIVFIEVKSTSVS
jgi:hypothetical protein